MQRWIIHVDMDAFFAAVEQRDHPDLRGKPVIVGGTGARGVVSTASYEARQYGVHSAMPMYEARRRCPQGVFLPGNHHKYGEVSAEFQAILADFSPLVEPLSLDEAFLDVTGMEGLYASPLDIAKAIKERIKTEIGLIASAGVAPNKFLAKLASDIKKPDGLVLVPLGGEKEFLRCIPIRCLWGVGKTTATVFDKLGIRTIGELAKTPIELLERHFGKGTAYQLSHLACGQDGREVLPCREAKSVGRERTFETDITCRETLTATLLAMADDVGWRLRKMGDTGRTITVKVRFASFRTITRSRTLTESTALGEVIYSAALEIWEKINIQEGVRLLGVSVSNLQSGQGQTSLFAEDNDKRLALAATVDQLKEKFGAEVITRGRLLRTKE